MSTVTRPLRRRVACCAVAVAAAVFTACSGGDTPASTTTTSKKAATEKTDASAEFATKEWTDATSGGDAAAVADAQALRAALDRAASAGWTIRYDVDSVSDVDFLTQEWKPPVMDSVMVGTDETGGEQEIRIVYDEQKGEVKTCGTDDDRGRCEVEPADSTRPRLRVFRNLSPEALRRSIGAAAERPGARFATRTILGRRAQCVTAPPFEGDGISQACVDDASGMVLYLDGLIENVVFDLLVVEAEITPPRPAAP